MWSKSREKFDIIKRKKASLEDTTKCDSHLSEVWQKMEKEYPEDVKASYIGLTY